MDRGAWRAIVHRVAKTQTRLKRLSTHTQSGNREVGGQGHSSQMPQGWCSADQFPLLPRDPAHPQGT